MKTVKSVIGVFLIVGIFISLPFIGAGGEFIAPVSAAEPLEVTFSHESGFYGSSFKLTLTAPSGAAIYYTLNGNPTTRCVRDTELFTRPPAVNDILYTSPLDVTAGLKVDVFTIRAYAVKDGKYSPVAVRNYVKGENVHTRFGDGTLIFSLNSDPHGLYDHYDGVFVFGIDREQWRQEFFTAYGRYPAKDYNGEETPGSPANFNRSGENSARRAYVEMFDTYGNVYVSKDIEMRVKGGYSRSYPQKTLELYARDKQGNWSPFLFPFFEENTADGNILLQYRRFRLRNGGSDRQTGLVRDELCASLLRQAGFPMTQTHTPAAVFLNGEYYGVSWIKTPRTENHFRRLFGGETSQYYYVQGGESYWESDTPEAITDWRDNVFEYAKAGLTDNNRWNTFQNRVNIDDMMLYYAFQIYIQNQDWPNHNMEMWRYVPSDDEKNDPDFNPRLKSGKWSWSPHDLESSFDTWGDSSARINTIANILNGNAPEGNPQWQGTSALLRAVLARSDMKGRFANTLVDLMEGVMKPENVNAVLDDLIEKIDTEHNYALANNMIWPHDPWGTPQIGWPNTGSIKSSRDRIRNFASQRPDYMYNFINTTLGYNRNNRYSVNVTVSKGGEAVMNSRIIPEEQNDTGNYYNGTSIAVTAKPYPGYEISHWEVNGTTVQNPVTNSMTVNGASTVKVYFEKSENMNLNISAVKSTSFSSTDDDGNNWLEIHNPTDKPINTRGLYLSDNNSDTLKWKMPSMIIFPGETLRFITKQNDDDVPSRKRLELNFNINLGETLRLSDATKLVVSYTNASLMYDHQIQVRENTGKYKVINAGQKPPKPPPLCSVCGEPLPCSCDINNAPVKLMAQSGLTWTVYESETVNITGNGSYSTMITIPGSGDTQLVSFSLMARGGSFNYPEGFTGAVKAPSRFSAATVRFDSVKINGVSVRNTFNRNLLGSDPANDLGYVRASLWNAWGSRYLNTSDIETITMSDGGVAFGTKNGEPITSIEVEFTVSGVTS